MNKSELQKILADALYEAVKKTPSMSDFSRTSGIPRSSIGKFINQEAFPSTPTLQKLLPFVELTEEVQKQLALHAEEASKSAGTRNTRQKKEQRSTRKKPQEKLGAISSLSTFMDDLTPRGSRILRELGRHLAEQLRIAGTPRDDESEGDVRFLLTRRSFRPLGDTFSREEIADTLRLIIELTRRWKLFAELEDADLRAAILKALGSQMNALFLVMRATKERLPLAATDLLEKQARAMGIFKSDTPETTGTQEKT